MNSTVFKIVLTFRRVNEFEKKKEKENRIKLEGKYELKLMMY